MIGWFPGEQESSILVDPHGHATVRADSPSTQAPWRRRSGGRGDGGHGGSRRGRGGAPCLLAGVAIGALGNTRRGTTSLHDDGLQKHVRSVVASTERRGIIAWPLNHSGEHRPYHGKNDAQLSPDLAAPSEVNPEVAGSSPVEPAITITYVRSRTGSKILVSVGHLPTISQPLSDRPLRAVTESVTGIVTERRQRHLDVS